jgi:assimilatory nitrate reductase catalytic subunit
MRDIRVGSGAPAAVPHLLTSDKLVGTVDCRANSAENEPGTPLALSAREQMSTTATHCPYCALQCGMHLSSEHGAIAVHGNARFPVNRGGLCVKGWTAAATLAHADRLREPLVRGADGHLGPASWDAALNRIAEAFVRIQARYGDDAVAVFGSGALTNEKAYLVGKFARVGLGTANVDYNGRFCMSSAAAAGVRAFGIDRGLPFPLEDIPKAAVIFLVGGNPAETMPPLMQYFEAQQRNGGCLIVADPRRTPTASWAQLHLPLRPGTDAALANGLLHILIRDRMIDESYIDARTEGFGEARRIAASYWPERVEQITGVPELTFVDAAHRLGKAATAMVLTARGPEQQAQGVMNTLAYVNIALALGMCGRVGGGFGTLTGQGNGQGGREHGQKSDQLPGCRWIDDPAARRHIAEVWNVPVDSIPGRGRSAYELIETFGRDIHGLLVVGSNIVVSAPDAVRVEKQLSALDTLVVADFFLSETAQLAHVVLPSAQWAEEDGTITNLEGRVIRRRRVVAPPPGVRSDIEMLCGLAAALGKRHAFTFGDAADVFAELRKATRGAPADYSGISYDRLDDGDGMFWPCPTPDHPGTPRLFADTFATTNGRARFHATPHTSIADQRSDEFPLYLTTGRALNHYQSGNQTRRIAALQDGLSEPLVEMHPAVAHRAGVSAGDVVTVSTRRGATTFRAKITHAIREDALFVPFHWGGLQSVNRLTSPALDPISRMPEFKVCAAACRRDDE